MEKLLDSIRRIIPAGLLKTMRPAYHYVLALSGALLYCFPSRKIKILGVTGTKGKSSVCELANAILEENGQKTAVASTIRFKIDKDSRPNLYKMTMPGRFFIQEFISRATRAKCDWVVLEMTSEGVKQFRHKFVQLDALIFTNLAPEHIESHGSYEKYLTAKLKLARLLEKSPKQPRAVIANADDKEGNKFLSAKVEKNIPYRLKDGSPYKTTDHGVELSWKGTVIKSPLRGEFNIYNILAVAAFAESQKISPKVIKSAVEKVAIISGRGEEIRVGQNFTVVVDYAHTPESLEAIYKAYPSKRICVLGSTGGGRDKWKRPKLGEIADQYCDEIILTDEDPYDEDPKKIVEGVRSGIKKHRPEIIMDRREAIKKALEISKEKDVVLITGKGTDPYIMKAKGEKLPWSDAKIAREELNKLMQSVNLKM